MSHRDVLFDTWDIYNRVLDYNYMHHDEMLRAAESAMLAVLDARGLRVLDLGCGDARHLAALLPKFKVASYHGYDLSLAALDQARANLSQAHCMIQLNCADIRQVIRHVFVEYDFIFSSYTLHHFNPQEQREIFRVASQSLAKGGLLMLIDMCREPGENRDDFVKNYCNWIRQNWRTFSVQELAEIEAHVSNCDFPWSQIEIEALAGEYGFTVRRLAKHQRHVAWALTLEPEACSHRSFLAALLGTSQTDTRTSTGIF